MEEYGVPFWFKALIVLVVMGVCVGVFIAVSISIIDEGERGVVYRWKQATGRVMMPGLNWKLPYEHAERVDIKTQLYEAKGTTAASKDMQSVTTDVAVNYKLREESVIWLRTNIGQEEPGEGRKYLRTKVIMPVVQEVIKATTALFEAEELLSNRSQVREQIHLMLQEKVDKLSNFGVQILELSITEFTFSEQFDLAIEAKVEAEQLALKAERDLVRVEFEAKQKIETAKAEAEAIRIQAEALVDSPEVLELRWIEKWNGVLPNTLLQPSGEETGVLMTISTSGGSGYEMNPPTNTSSYMYGSE